MKSNYKKLGKYIREISLKNVEDKKENLLGVSTRKVFIKSVANTVGTNFKKYKIVKKHQFTYVPDTSRRGDKIGIAMLETHDEALVSQVYTVFEIIDTNELLPEYLMMWFRRPEFDRYARYMSHGSVREIFDWEEMCDVDLPVPAIEKQREIVEEYNTIVNCIKLNEQLNQKLEETARAIYKQWFVDFEFPISAECAALIGRPKLEGKPYRSSGGELIYNDELEKEIPFDWEVISIKSYCTDMKSGGTPSRVVKGYWNPYDVPWLKTGEVANNILVNSEENISYAGLQNSSAKLLPINAILMAMYGDGKTKGQVGYLKFEATTNQACCAMICENESLAAYLYYYLFVSYSKIVNLANGGAQDNLSKKIIEALPILNPFKHRGLNHPFLRIINIREKVTRENLLLNQLKDVLLQKVAKI